MVEVGTAGTSACYEGFFLRDPSRYRAKTEVCSYCHGESLGRNNFP
jgi:hypothetical protein